MASVKLHYGPVSKEMWLTGLVHVDIWPIFKTAERGQQTQSPNTRKYLSWVITMNDWQ